MSNRRAMMFSLGGVAYDADAQAFLNFIAIPNDGTIYFSGSPQEITGSQYWTAVNNLVVSLKSYSIWSKLLLLNLKVGGTATTNKINAKDPRDLDAAFRYTYGGSWVHYRLGSRTTGGSDFANTYLNLNTLGLNANFSFGYYLTVANLYFGDQHGMGAYSSGNNFVSLQHNTTTQLLGMGYGGGGTSLTISTPNDDFFAMSVIGTQKKVYQRNLVSTGTTNGTSVPTINLYEGALNFSNSYYNGLNTTYGTSFVAQGLTETEMSNLRTSIVAFETALFRNV